MIPVREPDATLPVLPLGPDVQDRGAPSGGREPDRHGYEAEELQSSSLKASDQRAGRKV